MAKKKVKKVTLKNTVKKSVDKESYEVKSESLDLFVEISKINKRIDRIVAAISTAKPITKDM